MAQARQPGAGGPEPPTEHVAGQGAIDGDHETSDLSDGGKSIGRMSWGQYGAVAALLHPDEQRRVIAEGHEIGIHGWIHELNFEGDLADSAVSNAD